MIDGAQLVSEWEPEDARGGVTFMECAPVNVGSRWARSMIRLCGSAENRAEARPIATSARA